ncbi:hypothetical protein KDA_74990 [Dictyobacter alpinus]|uniref:Uncharacterized protein n=1 Tax=Dictyobacter alpinus TaxID=2014873 RepID=A0A402BKX5_9CHLR|nr:hypothetical protein [Dictyobacter alpinus]GCE32015.1 hypothetical protein KDA_74990 [Dictyobacter alpinus]
MAFDLNTEIVVDYRQTFPERRGETLLHFGNSWNQEDRLRYEQRAMHVVQKLAERHYICQPGKRSGDTGLVELVRVVEQTGFTYDDLRPVPPDRLAQRLAQLVPYPVTQETVQVSGQAQIVVCVEI